jgi:hypothetical protein
VPWPNPNPVAVSVELDGWCPSLTLKLYTESMRMVGESTGGAAGPGWGQVALPGNFSAGAANGTYYYRILPADSVRGAAVGRLVVLH